MNNLRTNGIILKENYLFSRSADGGLNIWDTSNNTYFHFSFGNRSESILLFKGKRINISFNLSKEDGLHQFVDFYGLDSKEYLRIDRCSFKKDKVNYIKDYIETVKHDVVDFLLEQNDLRSLMLKDMNKGNSSPVDCYLVLWQMADSTQKETMMKNDSKYIQPITTKLDVLNLRKRCQTNKKEVEIGTTIMNYQNFLFTNITLEVQTSLSNLLFKEDIKKIDRWAEGILETINDNECINIVLGENYIEDVSGIYLDQLWFIKELEDIFVYSFATTPSYHCRATETDRKNIIKVASESRQYVNDNSLVRYAIPVFEGYDMLALEITKIVAPSILSRTPLKYGMISPILSGDSIEIGSHKIEFILQIVKTPEFHNLVDYVFENRADPTPCTKDDIIKAYRSFMSEYYDIMHEDETVKEESGDE